MKRITTFSVPFVCMILSSVLVGCGSSQARLDAQSTQAAFEIYGTQTRAAEDLHATQTAVIPTWTFTPTRSPTATRTTTPTPTNTALPSLPGLYQSSRFPFSIEYPAEWTRLPSQPGITIGFGNLQTGVSIYIAEEDLNEIGLGEASLQEYLDVIMFVLNSVEGFELITDKQVTNANGLAVEILDFRLGPAGSLRGRRLVYVHDNRIGFNATYLALEENFIKLVPAIESSFDSFMITE